MIKKILSYVAILVFFLVLSYAFVPEAFSGKVLNQADSYSWIGMSHEATAYNSAHPDDKTFWTDSMFGGMPTFAMIDNFEGDATSSLYKALIRAFAKPVNFLLLALVGAFLLLLSMGVDKFIAAAGAVGVAFCSYNFQIIQVGHNTKMQAIAFFPYVLAAFVFTYRSALSNGRNSLPKTLLGSVLFALALDFQIKANHVQITYYLAIVIFVLALALLISLLVRKRTLGRFFLASAFLLAVGCIGIATNANKLIPTYEYTPYTMRGGSELVSHGASGEKGLELDYATAWSYGVGETPNLLIPNFNGGASGGALKEDSAMGKLLKSAGYKGRDLKNTLSSLPLYWGPQPFTAGPMYLGAISLFLFLLGLMLVKGKDNWWKWGIAVCCIISVFLAWGSHFIWFTRIWYNWAPMYNKFRTVSMALVMLQVLVPVLGFYVLDRIFKEDYDFSAVKRPFLIAWVLTGGFSLLCWLFPSIAGTFCAPSDSGMQDVIVDALVQDRKDLLRSDALRSFILVSISVAVLLWAYAGRSSKKGKSGRFGYAAAVVCLLVVFDLFSVGKRYLGSKDFVTRKAFDGQFTPRPVDERILQDQEPSYRVMDLSVNTFNDAFPSYFHKTIGGYSPVKMQRYQDLIERHIQKEMSSAAKAFGGKDTFGQIQDAVPFMPVVSMLNTKYIIIDSQVPPVVNPYAFGTAWFVGKALSASSVEEEINLLSQADLRSEAVIGEDYSSFREKVVPGEPSDTVYMLSYTPKEIRYSYKSSSERVAVFSEIFYKDGWKLSCDGKDIPLFRANWILRAAVLPQGEGELVMRFEPECIKIGKGISNASSIILLVLLLLSVGGMFIGRKKR